MEYVVYIFLALTILALLILFVIALKFAKLVNKLHHSLILLPSLIEKLKNTTDKVQENLEISKATLDNFNQLISNLKILPSILEELGQTTKDLTNFLKGQIEIVKDDLHFTLEDARGILKDTKEISSELKNKTLQISQGLNPFLKEVNESFTIGKEFLEHLNHILKKTYIEVSALSTGLSEILRGIKKLLHIKKEKGE